ncbi:hypothetical protein RQP46_009333 [Phenoliferia psychrophenolica]
MHVSTIICTLALAAWSLAITIDEVTGWTTTATFTAILANFVIPLTLVTDQSTSARTFTVTSDSDTQVFHGQGFQIKWALILWHPFAYLRAHTAELPSFLNSDSVIIAQSGIFDIAPGVS